MKKFLSSLALTAAIAAAACAPLRTRSGRPAQHSGLQAAQSGVRCRLFTEEPSAEGVLPLQIVIAAPYRSTLLTSENFAALEAGSSAAKDSAQVYAAMLGFEIVQIVSDAGIYKGAAEFSRTYILKGADRATADLFASLMADLGAEPQESVIALDYGVCDTPSGNVPQDSAATDCAGCGNAWELTFRLLSDVRIEPVAAEVAGGGTFSPEDSTLRILCFDSRSRDSLGSAFASRPQYEMLGCRNVCCRLLEKSDRQRIYSGALSGEALPEALHSACRRALEVCR